MTYTLESGTRVTVNKLSFGSYHFTLEAEDGGTKEFTYVEGERTKAEWDEVADFDQLEALRRFWLETEDIL